MPNKIQVSVVEEQRSGVRGGSRLLLRAEGEGTKVDYYVASYTPSAPDTGIPETLVFASDAQGNVTNWRDVAGGRNMSLQEATDHLKAILNGRADEQGLLDNPMFQEGVEIGILRFLDRMIPPPNYYASP